MEQATVLLTLLYTKPGWQENLHQRGQAQQWEGQQPEVPTKLTGCQKDGKREDSGFSLKQFLRILVVIAEIFGKTG